jgi:hypothetical protein
MRQAKRSYGVSSSYIASISEFPSGDDMSFTAGFKIFTLHTKAKKKMKDHDISLQKGRLSDSRENCNI